MPVALSDADETRAFADGERLYVTAGMLRFVQDDGELALVLAHEMAHNTRGHAEAMQVNVLLGAFVGVVINGLASGYGTTMTDLGEQI